MTKSRVYPKLRFRFFLVRSLVIVGFVVLASRLVYVQGFMRSELRDKANRQVPRATDSKPTRFSILDRNRLPLAETMQVTSCYVDPTQVKDSKACAKTLASVLDLNYKSLHSKIESSKRSFIWIKRDIPENLVAKIRSKKIAGIHFKSEFRRHFPMGPISTHLLGMVGIDEKGLSGIEQKHNSDLIKKGHVQLAIDGWVQQIVERELDWGAKKTKAKKGMVVAQDPQTGEILALATWPPLSLDPDHPPASIELRIPTLSDVFEPGSTFKIVVAGGILEEGLLEEKEIFDGEEGKWPIADIVINDHDPLGMMTFDDIFIYSSNIGTAKLANKLGSKRLYQYSRSLGFGVYPGTGLPGEIKGMLKSPTQWSGISKNIISFGQEVGVTAIQLAGAYSAIANGGILMEPKIVKGIISRNDDVLSVNKPSKVRRVFSEKTAGEVARILTAVVESGTGGNAQIQWGQNIQVAGKTGTAQKVDPVTGRYRNDLTLVSFCGFFPAKDPKMTLVVILDEPEGRRWGGTDAAPIFRRIAEQITSQTVL